MIFFIADLHLGHEKIIEYTGRPYKSIGAMDYDIMTRWNSVVDKDDLVIVAGDFCFGNLEHARAYLMNLNGSVMFVTSPTHHDKVWAEKIFRSGSSDLKTLTGDAWVEPNSVCVLRKGHVPLSSYASKVKQDDIPHKIVVYHFPIAVWEDKHYGSWHVHGHVHDTYTPGRFSINVSVENIGYRPISLEELSIHMKILGWKKDWNEFEDGATKG